MSIKKQKLPLGQVLQVLAALRKLSESSFPAREAFAIGKTVARLAMTPDVVAAENTRVELIRKYGKEEAGQIRVSPEQMAGFVVEWTPVATTEIELDIHPLPLSIFDRTGIEMTPAEMVALEPFLESEVSDEIPVRDRAE